MHERHAGFTRCRRRDFARTRADPYPLMPHFPCFGLYREQVVQQADPVPATHTCATFFEEVSGFFEEVSGGEQIARDLACYEPLTVRDSSLSARVQAVLAARTGHLGPWPAPTPPRPL